MLGDPVLAVPADHPAQPVGVPGRGGKRPVLGYQCLRGVLHGHRGRRHDRLAVEPAGHAGLGSAELGQQPAGHVGGAGVDGARGRQGGHRPCGHRNHDASAALVGGGVVLVGEQLTDRQVRAAHPEGREQPGLHVVLPRHAGQHLHEVPGDQVAEVAVLEPLAQVPAERQEAEPADLVGARPVRVADPDQVVAGQSGPVRQQVGDGHPAGHYGIVHPQARQVILERLLPLEEALVGEGAHRRDGERLRHRPDGEQWVLGDRRLRCLVTVAPACGHDDVPVPDGGDGAPRYLPGSELPDNELIDALHGIEVNRAVADQGRPDHDRPGRTRPVS